MRKQPFAELSEPMSSSVSPRVDLATLTTEATALSREVTRHTVDPRVAALRHRTIPQKAFVAVIVNAPQRRIIRASGEQNPEQSASECPRKRNLSRGVFSGKVEAKHAWRKVRLRFVCTFGEAVKCGYTLPVVGVLFLPIVACLC